MGDAVKTPEAVTSRSTPAAAEKGKSVSRSHLVNRLNYLNFKDESILVSLRHLVYDDAIFMRVSPLPCAGEKLDCAWAEEAGLSRLLRTYRFDYLLIADGKKYLVVNSESVTMDESGLHLILPAACREFHARKIRRHPARDIAVHLVQNGVLLELDLVDFTPVSLRAAADLAKTGTLHWINVEAPVHLTLSRQGKILFSGECRIISQTRCGIACELVLGQTQSNINRFKNKRYRNSRQQLTPTPNVVFEHPLIDKRVNLKLADLSGSGFAVEESEGDCLLMTGLMIPDLKITMAQGLSLSCVAQVVSRNVFGASEAERSVRCGVAILDMAIHEHVQLLSILHQVANRKSYVCTEIDLDELWDFFFETGFIYPGKYAQFQANKERIKETYAKLYGENPGIARHFVYLDRGAILGHLAMVRFYGNSWLIHHHAARKTASVKAGLAVLDQVSRYLNELESFAFAHLRFVYCYYRPDNRFPSRIFGGFARKHGDQGSCSLDQFAYSQHVCAADPAPIADPWEFGACSSFDLVEVASFYRHVSGGLLTAAFDLQPGAGGGEELAQEYRRLGFRKESYRYALRKNGSLKAFFLVNCTDAGFNMAELTNCVTMLVLDDQVPRRLLRSALDRVSGHYEGGRMPVLTYPFSYVEKESLPYDKTYLLWILDMKYSDYYFQYCEGLFPTPRKTS